MKNNNKSISTKDEKDTMKTLIQHTFIKEIYSLYTCTL